MQLMKAVAPIPPRVRLIDIAQSTGLSVATVSMALSDHPDVGLETKLKVRQCSRKLGYKPVAGRAVRRGTRVSRPRLKKIGFMMLGSDLTNSVSATRVQSLLNVTSEQGIRLELGSIESDIGQASVFQRIQTFAEDLDGLILEGHVHTTLLRQLHEADVLSVVMGLVRDDTTPPFSEYHSVEIDAMGMGQFATEWLMSKGHRRIGFACGPLAPGFWTGRWLDGYKFALMKAGLPIDPELIQVAESGGAQADVTAEAFCNLPSAPSAFVLPGWGQTVALSQALARRGRALAPDCFVTSMFLELARKRLVEGQPLVCADATKTARVALDRLAYVFQHRDAIPTQIQVPFVPVNCDFH